MENLDKAIHYRAHYRSQKEADLILGGFVKKHLATLQENEKRNLLDILSYDDPFILGWLQNPDTRPLFFDESLFKKIRNFMPSSF